MIVERKSPIKMCVPKLPTRDATKSVDKTLEAAMLKSKLWPSNTKELTCAFLNTPGPNFRRYTFVETCHKAMNNIPPLKVDPLYQTIDTVSCIPSAIKLIIQTRIQPLIGLNIKFIPLEASEDVRKKAMLRISFNPFLGSWSYVGTDALTVPYDEATMNFAWFDLATVLHEFCHALGMIHEHQNTRKGIQWDEDKVYEWAEETQGWDRDKTYRNIIRKYQINMINAGEYDPYSIMLYTFPKEMTLNSMNVHENYRLSRGDVDFITMTYPGGRLSADFFFNNVYGERFYRKPLYKNEAYTCCDYMIPKRIKYGTPSVL